MSARESMAFLLGTVMYSLVIARLILQFAPRLDLLDLPSSRSSHSIPTPRGGGLAIVVAFFTAAMLLRLAGVLTDRLLSAVLWGGGPIAAVGFIDDRKTLPAGIRLFVHVGAALIVTALIGIPTRFVASVVGYYIWSIRLASVIAIVWATNLFNFMDGIDGIASIEAIYIGCTLSGFNVYLGGSPELTMTMLSLAFATVGFLVWNWPPARIFMGDVGSGFLGFILATFVLAMSRDHVVVIPIAMILSGVFIVDASVTLIRRVVRGDRWLDAHRTHAYQHLAGRWGAHQPVTIFVGAINCFWLLPWGCAAAAFPNYAALCMVAALLPLTVMCIRIGAGTPRAMQVDSRSDG